MDKFAKSVLFAGSILAFLVSFHSDILRNGNEPIAAMLAVMGLIGITVACWLWKVEIHSVDKVKRVKSGAMLECVAVGAAFGLAWVFAVKESYFAEGPSGRDLSGLFNAALFSQIAILAGCLGVRWLWRRDKWTARKSGFGTRLAPVAAALTLTCLNFQTHAEVISVPGKGRVILEREGFPLARIRRVKIKQDRPADGALGETLFLPNAARVDRTGQGAKVTRFQRVAEFPNGADVRLRDGTTVQFGKEEMVLSIPSSPSVQANFALNSAVFSNGASAIRRSGAGIFNVILAIGLILHSWSVAARLGNSRI